MSYYWRIKKTVVIIFALVLAFTLALPPGVASAASPQDESITGIPEWARDDSGKENASDSGELPDRFDMREKGWVTPVKLQSPWGTCWSFGAMSAAESAILSDADSTYDKTKLNLSEKHLAWFGTHPITEADDPAQVGEGSYPFRGGNQSYQTGGTNMLVTTLFAQGVGPVTEEEFPYRGVGADGEPHTTKPSLPQEQFEQDTEQGTLIVLAEINNSTPERERAFLEDTANKNHTTYADELAEATNYARGLYTNVEYSKDDDWSISAIDSSGTSNRFKHAGLIIKDGNVLPEYWNAEKTVRNEASMTAMKQELAKGRGIVINYKADQAQPGATRDNTFINNETWAQYTFQNIQPDHAVCIVGWDDNYSKENFAHYIFVRDPTTGEIVYGPDGKALVYDNSIDITTPPGDGAWIVKNSWGSQTDAMIDDLGNNIGYGDYGIRNAEEKATGYFYLSYYDLTIQKPESMSFSSSLLGPTGQVGIFQHDYMTADGGFYTIPASNEVMSSANVFDLKKEDGDQIIRSVGSRTSEANQRVTFAIYQLNDGATIPTDGKLLYRTSSSFEYAGYHRLDLEQPVAIRAGHKYSIVSTVSTQDSSGNTSYNVSANQGVSQVIREYLYNQLSEADKKKVNPVYNKAVVNEGESFLFQNGEWTDWNGYINAIPAPSPDPGEPVLEKYIEAYPIDNFSIKMYTEPTEITLSHQDATSPTCTEPGSIECWWYEAVAATDTSDAVIMYYSDETGTKEITQPDTVIPKDPNAHKWGAWTVFDASQHQRVCEYDSSHVEKAAHEWIDGTDTCKDCGLTYPKPIVSDSTGGNIAETSDEIAYAVVQQVPEWATSMNVWLDLDPVLQYTMKENDVSVTTLDDSPVVGAKVSLVAQRLTVSIADASSLKGQTIQFTYKAKVSNGADLSSYLNDAKDTASVPYQASASFDDAEKSVSSETGYVKFKVSADKGAGNKASSLVNTGDVMRYVWVVIIVLAVVAVAAMIFANWRRKRG